MGRPRILRALFVRPAAGRALDPVLRFSIERGAPSSLPVPMLRLATAVARESKHRVFVHDDRGPAPTAQRSLRSVAALHQPDVAVVWLHPATLADGLDAARAVRHSGSPLVLGAGPLVDLWPEGARCLPELDGLLRCGGSSALLAALQVVSGGGDARALSEALDSPAAEGGSEPVDRKLLDYAAYRGCPAPRWPPIAAFDGRGLFRVGRSVDKGRSAASSIVVHDDRGQPLPAEAIVAEVLACDLLGIRWQALVAGPGAERPDASWWCGALARLRATRAGPGRDRRLRISVDASELPGLPLHELADHGIAAVDLGRVDVGAANAVRRVVDAADDCRTARVEPQATLLLGAPGYSLREEQAGLDAVRAAGVTSEVGVAVWPGAVDPGAWSDWLDAPASGFLPPGVDEGRVDLARRIGRVARARGRVDGPGGGLAGRLRRILG